MVLAIYFLSILIIFSSTDCLGGQANSVTLAKGKIYKEENLGPIVHSAELRHKFKFNLNQGKRTDLVLYYCTRNGNHPFQLLDLNLDNGQIRVTDGVAGWPGQYTTILHANGMIYIASADPGFLMAYDPMTGKKETLGKLADKGAQCLIEGDDGAIYLGEAIRGYMERYDPRTGSWENYGIIDDPGPPYYRYAYSLGADKRYIYVAMGQNPWYLVVLDRLTRKHSIYWKDPSTTFVGVAKGTDGLWYAEMNSKGSGKRWYRLQGDKPPELMKLSPRIVSTSYSPEAKDFHYELNLDQAIPDSGNRGQVLVKWRKLGEKVWKQASAQIRLVPNEIKRLFSWDGSKIFGFATAYGPVFRYDPSSRETTVLGRTQRSLYDGKFFDDRWFLAGYPAATLIYDPKQPWSLSASTKDPFASGLNPHFLRLAPAGLAKYHYFLAKGADGYIYVGGHRERDSVGGSLGWYHPQTKMTGGLQEPFLEHDIGDLVAVQGGALLVFSSRGVRPGIPGRLFVFDVRTKKLINTFTPFSEEREAGTIVEVEPGIVLGIIQGITKSRIYKMDVRSGKVLFSRDLQGAAFGQVGHPNRRLVTGPDGFLWLYLGETIVRLNPADGMVQPVLPAPPSGSLLFLQRDLYIYGGHDLRRVSDLFLKN